MNVLYCTHEFCAHTVATHTDHPATLRHRRLVSTQPITAAHISVARRFLDDRCDSESGDLTLFVELARDRIICCIINHKLGSFTRVTDQSSEPFCCVFRPNEEQLNTRLQAYLRALESSAGNEDSRQYNITGQFQNLVLQDYVTVLIQLPPGSSAPRLFRGAQSFDFRGWHTVAQVTEPSERSTSCEPITSQASGALQQLVVPDPASISNQSISASSGSEPSHHILNPLGEVSKIVDESLANLYVSGCRGIPSQFSLRKLDSSPVAEGGHGFVSRGELNGNEVAIKHPKITVSQSVHQKCQLVRNAAYEAQIWQLCDHINIQTLTAVTRFEGHFAMVSPWMRRGDLSKIIAHPGLSFWDRFLLATHVCNSIVYLHSLSISHGDIKSSNILLSDDGTPKLTDFGSAIKEGLSAPTREPVASLRWMPAEIWRGGKPTPQSDVYSLAMAIFEIFTGAVPYNGVQGPVVIVRIAHGVLPERPENLLPSGDRKCDHLWALLVSCWALDPEIRPTAVDVRDQLNSIFID
ncbi:unnamed protein product [Rhizoctonia solani]|uniref:Protein kinase domain-containing protein n=1 Tax=Rhizoctonia solani TaxID=456999 RepID=A0A8H3BMY2_9AGAM|nr:unnamed protein product [Rhizoctonia solani]